MSRPISGKHAIEVASFACVFDQPFSANSIQSLMTLEETFKDDYPVFNTAKFVNIKVEAEKSTTTSTPEIAAVTLQKLQKDTKRPSWVIKTEPSSIVVSCYSYDRWAVVSPKALNDLVEVIKVVDDGRNPINQFVLHVVDRFVGGPRETYKLNQVFNSTSKYLTRQVRDAGALWHLHQGWFEDVAESDNRILHNLNLSTNETPQGILTTIDHSVRHNFTQTLYAAAAHDMDYVTEIFNNLHEKNKDILTALLNKSQCKAINLCS